MVEALDPFEPKRRKLRRALLVLVSAAALLVAGVSWWRLHARHGAAARIREIARAYDRCALGADDVPDDQALRVLYLRALDGKGAEPERCASEARREAFDVTGDPDQLPDAIARLAHQLEYGGPFLTEPGPSCIYVAAIRAALAEADDAAVPMLDCALPAVGYAPRHDAAGLDGELLVARSPTKIARVRPDGTIVDERETGGSYAIDGDDLAFVLDGRLVRWRGTTRSDAPLPAGVDWLRAWRHTPAGDVAVFDAADTGIRAQHYDDALHAVGPLQLVPRDSATDDLIVGPDGAIGIASPPTCTAGRAMWQLSFGRVTTGPIGQRLSGEAHLADDAHLVAWDCDETRAYLVTREAYVVCDRVRCRVARTFPKVEGAGIRAFGGGAEALVSVTPVDPDRVLVDLRDPRGDGHAELTLYQDPYSIGALSLGGRWFLMHYP